MKPKRLLLLGAVVIAGLLCYLLVPGSEGRLRLPAGNHAPMVSLGDSHGIVLAGDGTLWSWGGEDRGWPVLGLGRTNLSESLVRIVPDTNWISVSAGDAHNLALKSDGSIWAWGANYRGQLGDGKSGARLTNGGPNMVNKPIRTVEGNDWVNVQAGFATGYALKRDGSLWAWGLNNFGQLGIGSWSDSPRPVQVGAATNWVKIRAGGVSAAGIQSDGSLWIWGGSPKLGNTTPQNAQNLLVPTRLTSDTNWLDVSVAFNLWLGIKSDGTLWAWGRNAHVFSRGAADDVEKPTQVGHDTDWQSIRSSGGGFYHLLRKRDGTFWVMDASSGNHTSVKLTKLALPANIVAWSAGGGAIAAITRDGEVWTCGTLLGQHGAKARLLRFLRDGCWRVGWKVRWDIDTPRVTREQPWQLRNVDPKD